eukprot:CAMPEP_0115871900 /NCGR_PEP_ID=MMETSP0287-20121206/23131_1 /TAXON_ID=412157 /ORGANISM="Chrysochromulina rotalis, Strain UIO044" /LENGTH=33 /DNA_ID= /DNA_START= /DNA_END= /DNA_ORIENTATION=
MYWAGRISRGRDADGPLTSNSITGIASRTAGVM